MKPQITLEQRIKMPSENSTKQNNLFLKTPTADHCSKMRNLNVMKKRKGRLKKMDVTENKQKHYLLHLKKCNDILKASKGKIFVIILLMTPSMCLTDRYNTIAK